MDVVAPLPDLNGHVELWVAQGVIDREAARGILRTEADLLPSGTQRQSPLVTEALGYVGGALVALGAVLLAAQLWDDWSTVVRVTLTAGCALVLVGAGAAMPASRAPSARRVRSVLLLLATATASFCSGLVAADLLELRDLSAGVFVTATTSLVAVGLWAVTRYPLQHAAAFAALAAFVGTALGRVAPSGETGDVLPGAGLVVLGAGWLALALVLARRSPAYRVALLMGSVGVVVGAAVLVSASWGRFAAVAVLAALIALAVRVDELLVVGVGTVGLLVVLPPVLMTWFPGAVAAPLVLLLGGALVVLLAARLLRRSAAGS